MSDTDEVLAYLHAAKARVDGGDTGPTRGPDAVRYARARLEEALPHAHAGAHLPDDARLKPVKQAVLGAVRPVTSHQEPFNRAVLQAVDGVAEALDGVLHRADLHEQQAARLQAGVATAELAVDDLADDVRSLRHEVSDLATAVAALHASVEAARSEAAVVRAQQDVVLRTARQALDDQGISVAQLTELSRELGAGQERLYEDLEDRFRGTADEVRAKVAPYLADIEATTVDGPVLDVGCGRGEWLGMLAEAQVEAYGIDTNEVVVERCRAQGLDVRAGDALAHLREVEPGTVRAVTSFHVVEHLSLDTLVGLLDAALVALAPGGALILETPNPTNLNVGAASFYLDPTHLKPLHPQFLEFLVAQRGFATVEGRYLNPEGGAELEVDDLAPLAGRDRARQVVDRINWALGGPMDFGIVARKAASA
ncbi:MAG: methyltransferase domain-containing protein [Acidimicrobiales bacterium]|nr:methyltransferase domain-containing protein [Acidimicrobiales bacterium]HRW36325.1 methyltransferase domain-containing protein [Aquihabitans sp.]